MSRTNWKNDKNLFSCVQLDSGNDIESIYDKHQGELLALETQHRDEIDELVAKYESEKAVKEALHDQVKPVASIKY